MNYKDYFEGGVSYEMYLANFEAEINSGIENKNSKYLPMNWQRSNRIYKTLTLDSKFETVNQKLIWLVISEHWCGDASQILPVMHKISLASNGKINLRLIYRDQYPELMEMHLTNGSKSIPKLIQLNEQYKLISDWGPRPKIAQELVTRLKSNPDTSSNYSEELHKWYAQDKQKVIIKELFDLINLADEFKTKFFIG
jgi:Thioredoxin